MILELNKKEMAALTLHMSIMRKNVRKGFKSNYGSLAKSVLSSYDDVKNTTAQALEGLEGQEKHTFNYNIKEIDMLHSFLSFYLIETEKEFSSHDLKEEDKEHLTCLEQIKSKVEYLKSI